MKVIVDRIEENKAVLELENGEMICVDKEIIKTAKEGDNITINDDTIEITQKRDTHSIFEKLRSKSKKIEY